MLACLAAMLVIALSGCSVSRKLNKQLEKTTTKTDSTSEVKTSTAARSTAKVDSTGKADTASRATETATNETTEETTTTEYDPATGKPARVVTTRRRSTGTAAKSSETKSSTTATTAKHTEAKSETETAAKVQVQKEEKRKTLDKQADTKSKPVLASWLLIAGGILVVGSLAWKFVPALASFGSGGPIGLFLIWLRKNKKQETA